MSVDRLLDDVDDELAALWGAGLALPGPDRAGSLRALAERVGQAGLDGGRARLDALARYLEAPEEEVSSERRARLVEAHEAAQRLATWARTVRAAWSLEVARERLRPGAGRAATKARVPGWSGRVTPVGIERAGGRLQIHALDADGGWMVLADELVDLDPVDPLREPATSRLFQDRVVLLEVLRGQVELRDHPTDAVGGRRVARPAFHTRPVVRPRDASAPEPRVVPLVAHRVADGWAFSSGDRALAIQVDDTLAFDLEKRAALSGDEVSLRAVLQARSEGASLLRADDALGDPCWPSLDPAAFVWSPRLLLERGDAVTNALVAAMTGGEAPLPPAWGIGAIARWWLGEPPTPGALPLPSDAEVAHRFAWRTLASGGALPEALVDQWTRSQLPSHPSLEEIALRALCVGGAPGRALLEAHLALLRRGIERSGVLPGPMSLWAVGDALARLTGADPHRAPVARLGLPAALIRLAAVGPLGRWLRSGQPPDDEAVEALLLVLAAGEAERFVAGARPGR